MINPFENSAFDMTSLTNAINILPNMYGKMESLKLFPQKSVRTRNIAVEEKMVFSAFFQRNILELLVLLELEASVK